MLNVGRYNVQISMRFMSYGGGGGIQTIDNDPSGGFTSLFRGEGLALGMSTLYLKSKSRVGCCISPLRSAFILCDPTRIASRNFDNSRNAGRLVSISKNMSRLLRHGPRNDETPINIDLGGG